MDKQSLDLDHYVTNKSLDGLFYMVGQEEKKNPYRPCGTGDRPFKDCLWELEYAYY